MSDETVREEENQVAINPVDDESGLVVPPDYVLLFDSPDFETGEIVCATLASQGIQAVMQNPTLGPGANALPPLGQTWSHAVYVAPSDFAAAQELLSTASPSEEELAAEQAADPTTLEEAENSVRNA